MVAHGSIATGAEDDDNGHGKPKDRAPSGGAFPTTRWTLVNDARRLSDPMARGAIDQLIRIYLPALREHLIVRRRLSMDQADDLLQNFVLERLLERNIISRADRVRGKFRTFLLTTLDHFLVDEFRRAKAKKKSPERATVDVDEFEAVLSDGAGAPTDAVDRAWAGRVLEETIHRMRAECEASNRPQLWGLFERRVLWPTIEGRRAEPLGALVERYNLPDAQHASNQLSTAKRVFARLFRRVIAEYAGDNVEEIDSEVRDLWNVLAPSSRGAKPRRSA